MVRCARGVHSNEGATQEQEIRDAYRRENRSGGEGQAAGVRQRAAGSWQRFGDDARIMGTEPLGDFVDALGHRGYISAHKFQCKFRVIPTL